jgi:hypothetical protein
MIMPQPTVTIGIRVDYRDYKQLVALAQEHNLVHGDRLNVSAAARVALSRGLEIVSKEPTEAAAET